MMRWRKQSTARSVIGIPGGFQRQRPFLATLAAHCLKSKRVTGAMPGSPESRPVNWRAIDLSAHENGVRTSPVNARPVPLQPGATYI
jgi:hypothetical protein